MTKKPDTIADLVSLSGAHDKHQLSEILMGIIESLASQRSVKIFALSDDNGGREFNKANATLAYTINLHDRSAQHNSLDSSPELLICVLSQHAVRTDDGRTLLPAIRKYGISHILEITGDELNSVEDVQITACWEMWSNLYHMLDAGERDKLTGLLNRSAFEKRIPVIFENPSLLERRSNTTPSKSIAMIDIDHFKEVNDNFGHLYGDELIVQISRVMTRSVRQHDDLFRYGGEEFIVVLNSCAGDLAVNVMERFRKRVEEYIFPGIGQRTVSIGIADIRHGQLPSTVLDQADKALYYAKSHGRNHVHHYENLIADNKLEAPSISDGDTELF